MSYNYQDAPRESQQEYFGKVNTDNKETLYNALKHIEELEKENEELRNNGFTVSAMTEQQLKVALEKGEQLEKENAGLKERLELLNLNANIAVRDLNDLLTKAKELLKQWQQADICDSVVLFADTEQFLKEIEK